MAKDHISIPRDIAQLCLGHARAARTHIQESSPGLNGAEKDLGNIRSALEEAEQIEWYLGEILEPQAYKRS